MEAWSEELNPVEKSVTQRLQAQIYHGHTMPPTLAWSLHKNIRSQNLRIPWFWRDPQDVSLGSENHTTRGVLKSKKWETIPPDFCSLQARWYQFRFMMSRTRSCGWDWWVGLAKDVEMGSGWWVGVCEEDNKRKNWGGQKCAATWAKFSKETHL